MLKVHMHMQMENNHYLQQLQFMEKPAESCYLCFVCKERDVRPCYKSGHDNYHIHKECYDLSFCKKSSIVFNLSCTSTQSRCDFIFQKKALVGGGKGVCDACKDDVKGWFYECKRCRKPHYLHPCCAHLPIKESVYTCKEGEIVLVLEAGKCPSNCRICGMKKLSNESSSGWSYISRNGKYCFHWPCMKHMALKEWKKDEETETETETDIENESETDIETETESQSETKTQTKNETQTHFTLGKVMGCMAEAIAEVLNAFMPLIFGLPPLPFGLVLKLLK